MRIPSANQLKELKKLLRNSRKENLILLEGNRTIVDAIRYGFQPHSIFVSDIALQNGLKKELKNFSESLFKIDQNTLSKFSEVTTSQGILGLFHHSPFVSPQPTKSPLIVLCDRISDPGNLGSMIRSGYAFGVDLFISVETCDIWSAKVIRSSMAYGMRYPLLSTTWDSLPSYLIEYCLQCARKSESSQSFQVLITDCQPQNNPQKLVEKYYDVDLTIPTLLVIGSEAFGVSPESHLLTQRLQEVAPTLFREKFIHIPMVRRDTDSLNAASACSIVLGEVQRQRDKIEKN